MKGTVMNISQDIRRHIVEHISEQSGLPPESIADSRNFIADGLLDSFSALTLLVSLETTFHVQFEPIELSEDSAQTIGGLVSLIIRKQNEKS